MNEIDRLLLNLQGKLLLSINVVSLAAVCASIVARMQGVDTTTYEWGMCWGLALGCWASTTIAVVVIALARRKQSRAADSRAGKVS
jgi:hypothetical protein